MGMMGLLDTPDRKVHQEIMVMMAIQVRNIFTIVRFDKQNGMTTGNTLLFFTPQRRSHKLAGKNAFACERDICYTVLFNIIDKFRFF